MQTTRPMATPARPRKGKFTEGLLDQAAILDALNITAGQTIVDAGCGTGYMTRLFALRVASSGRVYALDIDKYFIDALEKDSADTNILAMQGDITRTTKLAPSSVDLIYVSTVIHSFTRRQVSEFVREATRLLKPEGLLAIVEIEKSATPFGPPLNVRYSPGELKKAIPLIPIRTLPVGEHFYMQIFKNCAL